MKNASDFLRRAASWSLPLLLFVVLVCPVVSQKTLGVIKEPPAPLKEWVAGKLVGGTVESVRPPLHWHDWRAGDFQTKFGVWFSQNYGFRAAMVRVDNQIGYTVFHKSNTTSASIIVGKNKELYEKGYVDEYCGIAHQATDAQLNTLVRDMAEVSRRLRARGVGFVIYLSPSKPAVYPEFIPSDYLAQKTSQPRCYDTTVALMDRYHVLYADGHNALMQAKAARPNDPPLFCRGGTHYSGLGAFYATRALFSVLEKAGNKPLPTPVCRFPVPVDFHPTGQDEDLAQFMNVWFPPTYYPTPHPDVTFDWTRAKPGSAGKLSVIGGSFCWQPLRLMDKNHVYDQMDFYYYYHTSRHHYPGEVEMPLDTKTLDWKNTLLRSNVIVLEIGEAYLQEPGDTHFRAFLRDAKAHLPDAGKTTP